MSNTDNDGELEDEVQRLRDEVERLKQERQQKHVDRTEPSQEQDTKNDGGMKRRRFLKGLAGGAAGLGALGLMGGAHGFKITSGSSFAVHNSTDQKNFEVDTQGVLTTNQIGHDGDPVDAVYADAMNVGTAFTDPSGTRHTGRLADRDTNAEIRDIESNLSDYTPKKDAKFVATDTGAVYLGDGSSWIKSDRDIETLRAKSVDADTARATEFNSVVNLSRLVDEGEYSDILAAIEGEAASRTRLFIEPGTYTASTPITLDSINAMTVGVDMGAPWSETLSGPVVIKYDGDPTVPAITLTTDSTVSHTLQFKGIDFEPAPGNETAETAILSKPTNYNSVFYDFENCRWLNWGGPPIDNDQTDDITLDWRFRDCVLGRNAGAANLPQGTEWTGGRISHNEAGVFAVDSGWRSLFTDFVADITNGAHCLKVNHSSQVYPKNLEGSLDTDLEGSIGVRTHGSGCAVAGRITGMDVALSAGIPGDNQQNRKCYYNTLQFQNNNTADIRYEGDVGIHNGTYALVKRIDDVAFAVTDKHDQVIDCVNTHYNVDTTEIPIGARFFDRGKDRFYWGTRSGIHYFTPDGAV